MRGNILIFHPKGGGGAGDERSAISHDVDTTHSHIFAKFLRFEKGIVYREIVAVVVVEVVVVVVKTIATIGQQTFEYGGSSERCGREEDGEYV